MDYVERVPTPFANHLRILLTHSSLGDLINTWRKDTLELDPIPITEGPNLYETLKIPFTYCWSPALTSKPEDWGPHIGKLALHAIGKHIQTDIADVSGFFFREPVAYNPPAELDEFLRAGQPPVYIGFGSIVLEDMEETMSILLDAIQITGVRAIIAGGWSELHGQDISSVYYIRDCPHEWLFKHVAAVVHHGGAGTTACGLRNGKPTTIIPFFGE
jgi:Glycosyl transferases, related to UDP-glucuronosyltransferase